MKCVVPGCSSTVGSARFHYFPVNNAALCRTWLRSVRNPRFKEHTALRVISHERLVVCSRHFRPPDYQGNGLRGDAVPSVFTRAEEEERGQVVRQVRPRPHLPTPNRSAPQRTTRGVTPKVKPDKEETPPSPKCTAEEEPPQRGEEPPQHGESEASDESSLLKCTDVVVSTQCLLELLTSCSMCLIECYVTLAGDEQLFSVSQSCQSCGHHRVWWNHPNHAELRKGHKVKDEAHQKGASGVQEEPTEEPGFENNLDKSEREDTSPTSGPEEDRTHQEGTSEPEENSILKCSEVVVSTQCLLELLTSCSVCLVSCFVSLAGNEKLFSVIQDCQSCGHHRVWWSHPNHAQEHKEPSKGRRQRRASCIKVAPKVKTSLRRTKKVEKPTVPSTRKCGRKAAQEVLEKKKVKRKPRKQKNPGHFGSVDVFMDEGLFAVLKTDVELKLLMWCLDCKSDALLSCFVLHHKHTFCCTRCGDGADVKTFDKLTARFDDFGGFQAHATREHGVAAIHRVCAECGMLVTADPESRGMQDHDCKNKEKGVVCLVCKKSFATDAGLARHHNKCHENPEFPCKFCLQVFKDLVSRMEHQKTHPKDERPYSCPYCPEKFPRLRERGRHLKSHKGEIQYPCEECTKAFKSKKSLKKHKFTHTEEYKNLPLPPRRRKGKELSMEIKRTIIDLRNQKKSIRDIARTLNMSKSAVGSIIRRQARTGTITNKRRSGRPRKTTVEDDQKILSIMSSNPRTTIRQLRNEFLEEGREVSVTTIRRKLNTLNHTIEMALLDSLQIQANKPPVSISSLPQAMG